MKNPEVKNFSRDIFFSDRYSTRTLARKAERFFLRRKIFFIFSPNAEGTVVFLARKPLSICDSAADSKPNEKVCKRSPWTCGKVEHRVFLQLNTEIELSRSGSCAHHPPSVWFWAYTCRSRTRCFSTRPASVFTLRGNIFVVSGRKSLSKSVHVSDPTGKFVSSAYLACRRRKAESTKAEICFSVLSVSMRQTFSFSHAYRENDTDSGW